MQSIIRTGFGREKFGADIKAFWRKIVDGSNNFPPAFWQFFLQSKLTALGEKRRSLRVRMTWRRLLATGTTRQRRPRLEKATAKRDRLKSEYIGRLTR